jgi:hypothetical protein
MATVHEECINEEQRSVVRFLWAKRLNAKDIYEEMFSVYGGKCLSRKVVRTWAKKRGRRFADDEEVETEVRKWLRQQSHLMEFNVNFTYSSREFLSSRNNELHLSFCRCRDLWVRVPQRLSTPSGLCLP